MPKPTWRGEQILEMAVSAVKARDFERAAALCVNAIKVKPDLAEAFHIRGICLLRQERPFDALLHFEQALAFKPDMSDCWNNKGIAFAEVGMWESARACFTESLRQARTIEPHIMCGGMFAHLMQLEAAEREFKEAIEIEPQLQDAHVKLGVIQLGMGRWAEGFQNYQWRWFDTPFPPRPYRTFPKWEGQDLAGKTILLYSEQGFGDEIMALRFVQSVAHLKPARIIVEVRPTMRRLVDTCYAEAIAAGDDYPSGIDYSCPLLDVPMVLGLTPETMPKPRAYLALPDDTEWPARLAALGHGLKVGICWSSGRRALQAETEKSARAKSITLPILKPLLDAHPDVHFVSLQIPREFVPSDMKVADLTDFIDDFQDTARLVRALDLTITVDTSVAHLAGAIGARVWNLVRFNGYWPWMQPSGPSPEPTPWYPSMKLFRQPELGDWDSVIRDVSERLNKAGG